MRTGKEAKVLADAIRHELEKAREDRWNEAVRDNNTLYLYIMGRKKTKVENLTGQRS